MHEHTYFQSQTRLSQMSVTGPRLYLANGVTTMRTTGSADPYAELKRRRKGDEAKVMLARRLREETAVSLRWVAENLHMGTWTHVSNRLYHCR